MPLLLVFQGLGFTNIQGNSEVIGQVFGRTKDLKTGDIIQSIAIGVRPRVDSC